MNGNKMNKLKKLSELKTSSKLELAVKNIILSECEVNLKKFLYDLQSNGCVSGMVSELVYCEDTTNFYNEHKAEISDLLVTVLESNGVNASSDIFGEQWDKNDPLCLEQANQNLLAWFAFEETAFCLGRQVGIDL